MFKFFHGAHYIWRGFRRIIQPGYRRYLIIPLSINALLYAFLVWFAIQQGQAWMLWVEGFLPSMLSWLAWLLWPVFVLALVVVILLTFTQLANLLAAPINGFLAEKVEFALRKVPKEEQELTPWQMARTAPKMVANEGSKLLYGLIWSIPLLIISFIPVVNIIAPVLWFLFSAWLLALEYVDFPMDSQGHSFKEVRKRLRRRPGLTFGFGMTLLFLVSIPIINLLVLQAAVAGATEMWWDHLRKKGEP
ncbi:sulfate transporter CysZ [Magnetococcales bacterium HHB-1]